MYLVILFISIKHSSVRQSVNTHSFVHLFNRSINPSINQPATRSLIARDFLQFFDRFFFKKEKRKKKKKPTCLWCEREKENDEKKARKGDDHREKLGNVPQRPNRLRACYLCEGEERRDSEITGTGMELWIRICFNIWSL